MTRIAIAWLCGLWLLLGGSGVQAHDLPVNSMMNAFVKVDAREADLVVRVPLDLVAGVPFPRKAGGAYDTAGAAPVVDLAAHLLADGFVLTEDGRRLVPSQLHGRLSAPADRSFETYDGAAAAADGTADPTAVIPADSGFIDLHYVYPIASTASVFKIQAQVAVDVGKVASLTVRYLQAGEPSRAMIIAGGSDPVDLDPTWYRAAGSFIALGIDHILTGTDHLLFLFCLVIPVLRLRGVLTVITAFTAAHSITLFASAFHLAPRGAWFPPLVEMGIAASIVYTALENIAGVDLKKRWLITAMFGLIHGFGFSNALGESLQFAGSHLLLSLLSFNVGIEIGQLGVLALMLPALVLLRRLLPQRLVVVALSAVGAAIGGAWLVERWQVLREVDGLGAMPSAPWLCAIVAAAALSWLLARRFKRHPLGETS